MIGILRLNICYTLCNLSVKQRMHYAVYKMLNGTLPLLLRNKIKVMGSEECTEECVFYEGTKLYNSLPLGINERDG